MELTLDEMKDVVEKLGKIIDAPESLLPTFGFSEDTRPHIEVDRRGYHYLIAERGTEDRTTTTSLDDLLYRVFSDVISILAINCELSHRARGEDSRRKAFAFRIRRFLACLESGRSSSSKNLIKFFAAIRSMTS